MSAVPPIAPEFVHCSDSTKSANNGLLHCSKQLTPSESRRSYVAGLAAPASLETSTIRGSRIVKVEPRPGSLSTVMSPPIIWQNRRLMTSSSPVPPWPSRLACRLLQRCQATPAALPSTGARPRG